MTIQKIEAKIRWSGVLIVAGLAIEVFTLFFVHPLAFMTFLLLACPLIAIGILLFLYGLISNPS